jgi:V-type H+-transporting ATPase subunit F
MKIAVLGDSETIQGFQIAGIQNDPENRTLWEISPGDLPQTVFNIYTGLLSRKDIAIILVCDFIQTILADFRCFKNKQNVTPSILIIPSKNKYKAC